VTCIELGVSSFGQGGVQIVIPVKVVPSILGAVNREDLYSVHPRRSMHQEGLKPMSRACNILGMMPDAVVSTQVCFSVFRFEVLFALQGLDMGCHAKQL
jgi:hypothetical protein